MKRKFISPVILLTTGPGRVRLLLGAAVIALTIVQLVSGGHIAHANSQLVSGTHVIFADGGGGAGVP